MMNQKDFLTKMQEDVLDTDEEITMDSKLDEMEEWDSLAFVSFIAMANTNGKSINKEPVKKATTIRDLYELLQG